jgi:radical SAM superfamily enzyme with C-terminal helix-hairpin-helix motif
VTGVPHPLDANAASMDELAALPEIGRQRAGNIVANRPYRSVGEFREAADVDPAPFLAITEQSGAEGNV